MTDDNKSRSLLPYLLPVRCVVFPLIFIIGAALTQRAVEDISNWWSVAATIVNILTIALLVVMAGREGMGYKELIDLKKGQTPVKKAIPLIIGFVAVGMGGMYGAGLLCYGSLMPAVSLKMIAPIPAVPAVINVLLLPVTTALAEDGLYLGCGAGRIGNKYASVIVPALFYTLQHCFIPTIFDGGYMAYRALSFLPLTVLFCVWYRKSRDPLPAMIAHVILDLATAGSILSTSVIPGAYEQMEAMM
ncbi:MAG: hypothetical protein IKR73_08345 [Oscillospiraceae bacterium]|nr:hypothetical protein [Oscillospiraceae bacterium]